MNHSILDQSYAYLQPVNVQPASFSSFQPYQLQESEAKNLDMLMDIPLQVTVELGWNETFC